MKRVKARIADNIPASAIDKYGERKAIANIAGSFGMWFVVKVVRFEGRDYFLVKERNETIIECLPL